VRKRGDRECLGRIGIPADVNSPQVHLGQGTRLGSTFDALRSLLRDRPGEEITRAMMD